MFWMDSYRLGRMTLERSWMDGSGRRSLAVLTAQAAHSLSADVAARRLYWISDIREVCWWSIGEERELISGLWLLPAVFV